MLKQEKDIDKQNQTRTADEIKKIRQRMKEQKLCTNIQRYNALTDDEFYSIPGYENNYEINRNGVVRNKISRHILTYSLKGRGRLCVHLFKNDNLRDFNVAELMLKTFDPHYDKKDPLIQYVDGDKANCQLNNLIQTVSREQLVDILCPGYKLIPNSTDCCMNIKGDVIRMSTMTNVVSALTSIGYYYTRIYEHTLRRYLNQPTHRLLAILFIPIPDHLKKYAIEELQVHHKDENKLNNTIDPNDLYGPGTNLEWESVIEHRRKHSLGEKSSVKRAIKIKDLINDKISHYASISLAAKELNVDYSVLRHSINKSIINKRYYVKYEDDDAPWKKVKFYTITNQITGEYREFYYRRLTKMCHKYGISTTTFYKYLDSGTEVNSMKLTTLYK